MPSTLSGDKVSQAMSKRIGIVGTSEGTDTNHRGMERMRTVHNQRPKYKLHSHSKVAKHRAALLKQANNQSMAQEHIRIEKWGSIVGRRR